MKYDIFISYRREGGDTLAQLVYDRLVSRGYQVFLDIESLRSGKFNEKLLEVIEECQDVILILPPEALDRCKNPGDWVYEEISHALKHKKNIVPVMLKGFEWPSPMPEGLEELSNFNGIQDSKEYFDAVIEKMTGLLRSKPVLFGGLLNKLDEKKKKFSLGGWLRKHKKLVGALSVVTVAALALGIWVVGFDGLKKEADRMIWFHLEPTENTSVSAYRDSLEILEERIQVLTEGYEYEWQEKEDHVKVAIPWELVPDGKADWLLRGFLSRPMNLFLIGSADETFDWNDRENYCALAREDLQEVVYEKGRPAVLDPAEEGLETEEDYYYLKVTLTDEAMKRAKDSLGDVERYFLAMDMEEHPEQFYYYNLTAGEEGATFYSTDDWQTEGLFALTAHNWKEEALPGRFNFRILYPTDWEVVEDIASPGANQVNNEDLTGDVAVFQYTTTSEVTEGEFMDAQAILKARLDTLEVPYAIGHMVSGPHNLSIRMGVEHLSADMVDMILDRVYIYVEPGCGPSYQVKDVEILEESDGTRTLEVRFEDYYRDQLKEMTETMLSMGQNQLHLTVDSIPLASLPITEPIADGKVRFTNLDWYGKDTIAEADGYLLRFLEECAEGTEMPYLSYYLNFIWAETDDLEYGLQRKKAEAMEEEMQAILAEICPGAEVTRSTTYWSFHLNLPLDDTLPEKALEMMETIYKECHVKNGEYGSTFYIYPCEEAQSFYCYFSENTTTYQMDYSGYCLGEAMAPYREEVRQLEEASDFFGKEVLANEFSGGFTYE